jgi:hypothetical protein
MSTINARSLLDQVPSTVEPPANPQPSRVAVSVTGLSRRAVITAITGAAVASGLAVLDLIPWSRPRGALAAAYTAWETCVGYYDPNTICVPSDAYYGSDNCSGSWHRNDGGSGTCYSYRYDHYADTCNGHNAWKWTSGTRRKCSDGWKQYYDCGGASVNRFSICRTAI